MLCGFNWSNSVLGERRSVDWPVAYLPSSKDNKVRTLTAILIEFSIIFAFLQDVQREM
jgi:hypothetical protein